MTVAVNQAPYYLTLWIAVGMLFLVFLPMFVLSLRDADKKKTWAMAMLAFALPVVVYVTGGMWVRNTRADFDQITVNGEQITFRHTLTQGFRTALLSELKSVSIEVLTESGHDRSRAEYYALVSLSDGSELRSEPGLVKDLLAKSLRRVGLLAGPKP